jgi:hypothetical protein
VQLLERLHEAGFLTPALIKAWAKNPDIEILRARPDFKKVQAALEDS